MPLTFVPANPLLGLRLVKSTKKVSSQLWESFVFPANSKLKCFTFTVNLLQNVREDFLPILVGMMAFWLVSGKVTMGS